MTDESVEPGWQCVLISWGTRYPVVMINRLVARIREQASHPPRFVLITDRSHPGLDPSVMETPFPPFFADPVFRGPGCHAKLAMFEPGVVPADLPALYIDLDTVVTGDLSAGLGLMRNRQSVLMLQSAILPFGLLGRLVYRATKGRDYARGNSSVVVFHPAECGEIAARFREAYASHPDFGFRPMIADERFISWARQPHMIALPRWFAAKLSAEFMSPLRPWLKVRARLPWVARRRARLAAVTLSGPEVKPEILMSLPDGAEVTDAKGRHLIWSDRVMGGVRRRIIAHYEALE
jgi:hypothetical protein